MADRIIQPRVIQPRTIQPRVVTTNNVPSQLNVTATTTPARIVTARQVVQQSRPIVPKTVNVNEFEEVKNADEEKQRFNDERYKKSMEVYNKYKTFNKQELNLKRTRDILISLLDSEILAWDTETSGLSWVRDKLGCLTICNNANVGYYIPWEHIQKSEENQLLLLAVFYTCKTMVGANIKFDLHYL